MSERFEFQTTPDDYKKRLDIFLFERFSGLSKMYLREIVKIGKCEVNGRFENRGHVLKINDFVEIELDISRENGMRPENIPLEIVFEDEQLLVVNKPAGMLTHPTHRDKNGTLLNALTFYLNEEIFNQSSKNGTTKIARPGLIHRLDKQTSGLMVVAKTDRAHRILAEHFKRKLVEKRYIALVEGIVENDNGSIIAAVGRYAELKHWDIKTDGKTAETYFWVKERFCDSTLIELEPVTGRTNQLRIHCAHIGHPIVGDTTRGGREFERLCLHAYKIGFRHPTTGERLDFDKSDTF